MFCTANVPILNTGAGVFLTCESLTIDELLPIRIALVEAEVFTACFELVFFAVCE